MSSDAQIISDSSPSEKVTKEGWIRKRGGRMHQWSQRYFILNGPHISYKRKIDGAIKGSYDLTAGCALTEVSEGSTTLCLEGDTPL
jgi:hypothetical protein